jgi:hypothetical protein
MGQPFLEPLDDSVLDAAGGQPDRVRSRGKPCFPRGPLLRAGLTQPSCASRPAKPASGLDRTDP